MMKKKAFALARAALYVSAALIIAGPVQAHQGYDDGLKAYSCVDYPKALSLFKKYGEEGHGLSQYMVGIMVEQGQGTDAKPSEAFNWYMSAAKQGVTDAYYALADMYAKGISVEKNPIQAYAWYDLAKLGGHSLAPDMLRGIGEQLKPDQIAQAEMFVKDWLAKLPR